MPDASPGRHGESGPGLARSDAPADGNHPAEQDDAASGERGDVDRALVSPLCEAVPFGVIALGCVAVLLLGFPQPDQHTPPDAPLAAPEIEYPPAIEWTFVALLVVGALALGSLSFRATRRWLLPPPRNGPRTLWSLVELGQAAALAFVLFVLAVQISFRCGEDSSWYPVTFLLPQLALLASLSVLVFRQLCLGGGAAAFPGVVRALGVSFAGGGTNAIRGLFGYVAIVPLARLAAAGAVYVSDALGHEVPTHPVIEEIGSATGSTVVMLVLVAAVVAPIAEEVFFRGFLYATIRDRWGMLPGMVTSALLFAVVHKGLPNQAVTFVMGLLLAAYYERAGSLVVPVVAHALFNGVQLAFVLAAQ